MGLSADVAALLRELPARVAALEAAAKQKIEGAATAVENANIPEDIANFETKLQSILDDAKSSMQSRATEAQSLLKQLQAMNIPARIATIEGAITSLKATVNAGKQAPQGTAAQQTPPPAAQPAPAAAPAKPTT